VNLRDYAKGHECVVRLPNVCNRDQETVVLAHLKHGHYGSVKPSDLIAVHACSACHDAIDGRNQHTGYSREEIDLAAYRGLCEMLAYYASKGLVKW
jgi:putative nuclease YbcO-like protein